ncbi:hypothetical protein BGI31_03650 [Snodgrassella communis]|jgi:hypothetical protein|nr:hypothetical protein BGI31_03650 [Snodgrassella communis]
MMPAGLITASCLNINPHIFKINKSEKQCIYINWMDFISTGNEKVGWIFSDKWIKFIYPLDCPQFCAGCLCIYKVFNHWQCE